MLLKSLCYSFIAIGSLEIALAQEINVHRNIGERYFNMLAPALAIPDGEANVNIFKKTIDEFKYEDYSGSWFFIDQPHLSNDQRLKRWQMRCHMVLNGLFLDLYAQESQNTLARKFVNLISSHTSSEQRKMFVLYAVGESANALPNQYNPGISCVMGTVKRFIQTILLEDFAALVDKHFTPDGKKILKTIATVQQLEIQTPQAFFNGNLDYTVGFVYDYKKVVDKPTPDVVKEQLWIGIARYLSGSTDDDEIKLCVEELKEHRALSNNIARCNTNQMIQLIRQKDGEKQLLGARFLDHPDAKKEKDPDTVLPEWCPEKIKFSEFKRKVVNGQIIFYISYESDDGEISLISLLPDDANITAFRRLEEILNDVEPEHRLLNFSRVSNDSSTQYIVFEALGLALLMIDVTNKNEFEKELAAAEEEARQEAARVAAERQQAARVAAERQEAARVAAERQQAARVAEERQEAARVAEERQTPQTQALLAWLSESWRQREAERQQREAEAQAQAEREFFVWIKDHVINQMTVLKMILESISVTDENQNFQKAHFLNTADTYASRVRALDDMNERNWLYAISTTIDASKNLQGEALQNKAINIAFQFNHKFS